MRNLNFRIGLVSRPLIVTLLAVAILILPTALRADTVTYNVTPTDTFQTNIGPLTGTFTVNFSTLHATATLFVDGETFTCTNAAMFSPDGVLTQEGFQAFGPAGTFIVLSWSKLPSEPFTIDFSSVLSSCVNCPGGGGTDFLTAGDTANSLPEPSTALLLIPGLGLVLPFARRWRSKA
jgi:hypothetical protein